LSNITFEDINILIRPFLNPQGHPVLWTFALGVWIFSLTLPVKALLLRKYLDRETWIGILLVDCSTVVAVALMNIMAFVAADLPEKLATLLLYMNVSTPPILVGSLWVSHYLLRHKFMKFFGVGKRWYHHL